MLKSRLINFLKDDEGASAIEYALVAAMVVVAIATITPQISTAIKAIFTSILAAV